MRAFDPAKGILVAGMAAAVALLSSCASKPVPIASGKPPPVASTPYRPTPPMGAPAGAYIPPLQADGKRLTVNSGLAGAQTLWSLRSAYNVAALNCLRPQHAAILPGYAKFLKTHSRALKQANAELDRKYKASHGTKGYIKAREAYQTQVYNFFAYPPVLPALCDATVAMTQDIAPVPVGQLETFAPVALARLDGVYQQFYTSYAQYQADLAAWEARYGSGSGSSSGQSRAQ